MGTQHLSKCSQCCLLNWCCALQTIRDCWHPHKPTRGEQWPSRPISSSQWSFGVRGCCPPQPGREMGAGHRERHHVKEGVRLYRCPAGTTPQCSCYIPSANVVCVHSMKLFLYTKRISAAVRQMEGAFGRAEMSGTACVRKHTRGKNKIHYCAM